MKRRVPFRALAAGAIMPLLAQPAFGQSVGDAFFAAEQMLQDGTPQELWSAFDRATELFWAEAPLSFRVATFAQSVEGYGRYVPRADSRFSAGDRLVVYLEPVGYGWTAIGEEFRIRFDLDLEVASAQRGTLLAEEDFAVIERLSRNRGREFQATVAFVIPQLPAGDYELRLTLHDAATGKSASTALGFQIAE